MARGAFGHADLPAAGREHRIPAAKAISPQRTQGTLRTVEKRTWFSVRNPNLAFLGDLGSERELRTDLTTANVERAEDPRGGSGFEFSDPDSVSLRVLSDLGGEQV
jgi:hypothetical protein